MQGTNTNTILIVILILVVAGLGFFWYTNRTADVDTNDGASLQVNLGGNGSDSYK